MGYVACVWLAVGKAEWHKVSWRGERAGRRLDPEHREGQVNTGRTQTGTEQESRPRVLLGRRCRAGPAEVLLQHRVQVRLFQRFEKEPKEKAPGVVQSTLQ